MPSLDDLKKRIKSVKSTQKITKAMKMVAAAKLRKAQFLAEKGRSYSSGLESIVDSLVNSSGFIGSFGSSLEKAIFDNLIIIF